MDKDLFQLTLKVELLAQEIRFLRREVNSMRGIYKTAVLSAFAFIGSLITAAVIFYIRST